MLLTLKSSSSESSRIKNISISGVLAIVGAKLTSDSLISQRLA